MVLPHAKTTIHTTSLPSQSDSMTNQRQAQMGQTFFALNTLDNAPEYYNFSTAYQHNKTSRPQKYVNHRWEPYTIWGTQDFRQYEPETHVQLLPQPHFQACPSELYSNQTFVPPGPAPKGDCKVASTSGAGGTNRQQFMQMTMRPANVVPPPSTYPPPPVHAAASFDLRAPIMQQYPPVPSVVQSQIRVTSYDHYFDQGLKRKAVDSDGAVQQKKQKKLRFHPDDDPEFQRVIRDGEVIYRCLKEQCVDVYLKEGSVYKHKQTNKHQKRSDRLLCQGCGHHFSRSDALRRHAKSEQCCKNRTKSSAVAPAQLATTLALPGCRYSSTPLDSLIHAPESTYEFDASESFLDWYKRLEQPICGDLASIFSSR